MSSQQDQSSKRRKLSAIGSSAEREPDSVARPSASRDLLGIEYKEDSHIPDCCFLDDSSRKLKTFPVGRSGLLEKLSEFIPKLKQANDDHQRANESNRDCIEDIDESKPYIELDLFTGVSDNPEFGQTGSVTEEKAELNPHSDTAAKIQVVQPCLSEEEKESKS
mmetsp:Transcript_8517/g.19261  ORF Transcript_8517/g.19261 Transcript_8517/m.19261 type:complete len:164 (-) Transcript_8517:1575-2066(-)